MQTVTCFVSVTGFSAQKYDVTPTELALLRSIHGDIAISGVKRTADIERTDEEELKRLRILYGAKAPGRTVATFDEVPKASEDEVAAGTEGEAKIDEPAPKKTSRKK